MSLEFHEYSRIFKRPIPASYFKVFQALGITWIFKNIQAHKSWKFLEIPSSIFLQVAAIVLSVFLIILLIAKLRNMSLSDMSINWFVSYFDRKQELTFNDKTSDCISVKSGIGQGRIVGPLIFLLYINDIVRSLPDVYINMYAVDCILNQVHNQLQLGLNGFDEWCRQNRMVLNISKSKCLVIASRI